MIKVGNILFLKIKIKTAVQYLHHACSLALFVIYCTLCRSMGATALITGG